MLRIMPADAGLFRFRSAGGAAMSRDFELADLLGSLSSIIREETQELDDEIADREYEEAD
jgi:hypothetical protein